MTRPHVLLSVAVSIDGHIDDRGTERFPLSNAEDFDHVDRLRAESDAILAGAGTLRRDNARLLVYNDERRARRIAGGKPGFPLRVIVTRSGDLDPELRFWHCGGERLVYTRSATTTVGDLAETKTFTDFADILDDLGARGVGKLMVEGGTSIHTEFLRAGLADEIRVAVAPMLIGQATAPRFVNPAEFPGGPARRFHLEDVTKVGDVAVLRYFPKVTSSSPG
ncbi:RibD family protein [Lentzea jiangxiensis]|uniref:Riboflavin-specific deaminase C-terminal domain-containing protein n=1 Tax=Lentzea jiangxiensis TaxID=641025 RepID=A0A1H0R6I0_9PSEU|nr:dihydrofolate reductase family protein [Lentzea jiangxiensis]SDP25152.1 riboflavin-specific deaminase C-terminal domain-containing protein [Lentzea jiangxiensis]